jgi:hypothetical protein
LSSHAFFLAQGSVRGSEGLNSSSDQNDRITVRMTRCTEYGLEDGSVGDGVVHNILSPRNITSLHLRMMCSRDVHQDARLTCSLSSLKENEEGIFFSRIPSGEGGL